MAHDRKQKIKCAFAIALTCLMLVSAISPLVMAVGWLKSSVTNTHQVLTLIDAGDVDRDGSDEVYAVSNKGAVWQVKYTNNDWTSENLFEYADDWTQAMDIGDIDGDTYDEIYIASRHSNDHGRIYQYFSNGFSWSRNIIWSTFPAGDYPMDLLVGDANRNGINEVYYIEADGELRYIYKTGSNWVTTVIDTSYPGYFRCMALGDGDGDGQVELYVGTETNRIYQYVYAGGPIWSTTEIGYGGYDGYWEYIKDIIVGDPDKDGSPNVVAVAGDRQLMSFRYFAGSWQPSTISEIQETSTIHQLAMGDGDADGKEELFTAQSNNQVYHYYWNEEFSEWKRTNVDGQLNDDPRSIVVAEVDGEPEYKEIYASCEDGNVYRFSRDVDPPPTPLVWSPTHPVEVWKNITKVKVIWKMPASDPSGLAGFSFEWSTTGPMTPDEVIDVYGGVNETISPALQDGNNIYFTIKAVDNAENWGKYAMYGPIYIDTQPPTDLSIEIANDSEYVSSQYVGLTIDASDTRSGPANMSFSNDDQNWSDWKPYGTSYEGWDLNWRSPGGVIDGVRTVYLKVQDAAGNVAKGAWDDTFLDQSAPTDLGIIINNGDKYTNKTVASLKLSAKDPTGGSKLSEMSFSNDGSQWSPWEVFETDKPYWDLVNGNGGKDKDGDHQVYFRTRDRAGNIGGPVSATIVLDRVPPSDLEVIINSGSLVAKNTTLSIQLKGQDDPDHSGMGDFALKEEGRQWSEWTRWTSRTDFEVTSGDGTKFIYMKAKDRAGNEAEPVRAFTVLGSKSPRISHVRVLGVTDKNAVITWTTDIPANGVVNYGTSMNYNGERHHSDLLTQHSVTLSGLRPSTDYHFMVESSDAAGQVPTSSKDYTFTTRDYPDNLPPSITDLKIEGVSHDTAVLRWKTNEPSDTRLRYGPTSQYGMVMGNSKDVLEHRLVVTGLKPGSTYYFTASSSDPRGNGPTEISGSFKTADEVDETPPTITNLDIIGITDSLAIVTWQTNEPTLSIIEYGTSLYYGNVAVSEEYMKVHRVVLNGLQSDTMYHLIVRAIDPNGNGPTTTDDRLFFTTKVADRSPPVITNVKADSITSNSAVITWATDEPSDSGVEFYSSEGVGESNYDLDMVESHSIALKNLEPNTDYTFRVVSWDASGNGPSYSTEFTFRTSNNADIDAPILTDLRVSGVTNKLAIVMWETDELTKGTVEYGTTSGDYPYHVEEEAFLGSHSVVLWDLEAGSSYFVRVQCVDAGGNGPTISDEVKFMTNTYPDNMEPQITGVKVIEVTHNSFTVQWFTDEPSNSEMMFGKTGTYDMVAKDPQLLFEHNLSILNLESNTTYHFSVFSSDPTGNRGTDEKEHTVTTLDVYVPPPPPPPPPPNGHTPGTTNIQGAMPWIALGIVIMLVVGLAAVMYSKGIIGPSDKGKHRGPARARHVHTHAHQPAAGATMAAPHQPIGVVAASDEGLCPHCNHQISLTAAARKAEEEKRKEEEQRRKEAEVRRRREEAAARHRQKLEAIDKRLDTLSVRKDRAPPRKAVEEDHQFEEIPDDEGHGGHAATEDELEDLYDEVEEEEDSMDAEVMDDRGKVDWAPPRSPILEDLGKRPTKKAASEEAPRAAKAQGVRKDSGRVPLKTVTCGNCGSKVPVYTEDRPTKITCPSCNKSGVLKKK